MYFLWRERGKRSESCDNRGVAEGGVDLERLHNLCDNFSHLVLWKGVLYMLPFSLFLFRELSENVMVVMELARG